MWLNEGLAMVTVDRFAGKRTVQSETIQALASALHGTSPGRYRELQGKNMDDLIFYHCVRGYWLTRYLEETQPDLLRDLLQERRDHSVLERSVATAYSMEPGEFWKRIDGTLVTYFGDMGKP